MAIRIEDAVFSRILLNRTLEDVRSARPGIKTSKARFEVWSSTNAHGQRYMIFEYDGVRQEGYYWNAYEGRAAGWERWLQERGGEA